jgi:hypothetical protein
LDRLEEYYGFKVPREGGYDVVNALKAMHEEKVKFMFCMGGISFSSTGYDLYSRSNAKIRNVRHCFYKIKQRSSYSWERSFDLTGHFQK